MGRLEQLYPFGYGIERMFHSLSWLIRSESDNSLHTFDSMSSARRKKEKENEIFLKSLASK